MIRVHIGVFLFCVIMAAFGCSENALQKDEGFISLLESDGNFEPKICIVLHSGNIVVGGVCSDSRCNSTVLAAYSPSGNLIWKKSLIRELSDLRAGIPAKNGGFYLAGGDTLPLGPFGVSSSDITVVLFNEDGETLKMHVSKSIYKSNQWLSADLLEAPTGNLILGTNHSTGAGGNPCFPRIVVLSPDLDPIYDKTYYLPDGTNYNNLLNPRLALGEDGSIYLIGQKQKWFPEWQGVFSMKFDPSDYRLLHYKEFDIEKGDLVGEVFSGAGGAINITSAKHEYQNGEDILSYSYDKYYSKIAKGKQLSIVQLDTACNYTRRFDYGGFAHLGAILGYSKTRDGGYILTGISNINPDATLGAGRAFLLKLNGDFDQEWIKVFKTTQYSAGYKVFQTADGGYAVLARIQSIDAKMNMILIKTDANGNS